MYAVLIPPARSDVGRIPGSLHERLRWNSWSSPSTGPAKAKRSVSLTHWREMVAPTRAEPGNLDYQVFRDPKDPSLFVLFERYADADAFDAHRATPHFGTWLAGVGAARPGRPDPARPGPAG